MKLAEDYIKILPKGWHHGSGKRQGYICRVCHYEVIHETPAIISPNYSHYHAWCVELSPNFQKALIKSNEP